MRDASMLVGGLIGALLLIGASGAAARTQCTNDATAACVELASQVGRYDQLLWAACADDSATVCKCWNEQERDHGADWCLWAECACKQLKNENLKSGICGLSAGCASVAQVIKTRSAIEQASGPGQLAAQVEDVRHGKLVDCSPATCMAVGSTCARAAGALEMLKDAGKLDPLKCGALVRDLAQFTAQTKVENVTTALATCACAAVF